MSDDKPSARTRRAALADEGTPERKPIPAWRRRLYRLPVIGAVAYMLWPPPRQRHPSKVRRVLSWTATVVAVLGIGMAAYPVAGEKYPFFYRVPVEKLIEWSNVLSDLETNRLQGRLERQFAAMKHPSDAKEGDALTRIQIPSIGVDTIVVQGTSLQALAAGAGHYPSTPLPGQKGNVGIAGHRTTHGRPFNKLDRLRPGAEVFLTTPVGRYVYKVQAQPGGVAYFVTTPYDWSVVGPSDQYLLTLTACHPKGSARQRIVVRAKLARSEPREGAKRKT